MSKFKYVAMTSAIVISVLGTTSASWGGPNDFFGSGPYLPGAIGNIEGPDSGTPSGSLIGGNSSSGAGAASAASSPSSPAQSAPPQQSPSLGGANVPAAGPDTTADEKRMQKKYKSMIAHCKDLMAEGDQMMQKSPNKDSAMYKHGKIKKEIGEKHLTELQTSSPFQLDPSLTEEAEKKTKKKNGKS
jgi:hypothetical protein